MKADFRIEPTRFTPLVEFSAQENLLDFSGRSYPEDTLSFYARIEEFLSGLESVNDLTFRFYFEYLNSASIISILKIIKHFEDKKCTIKIEWHFDAEDEEILNVGKDIERLISTRMLFCEAV